MQIIEVVPYIGNISNGPSYSVPMLCRAIAALPGCNLTLHTLAPIPEKHPEWNFELALWPRRRFPHPALGRSPEMKARLREACRDADIIHNHSLWMLPNIYPEFVRRGTNCKLVVSPRGCLAPWALKRSPHKKLISRFLGQYANLRNANMLHATCEKEYLEIRRFGLKQPVVVLPNGVDFPECSGEKSSSGPCKLLFLGRLHPVKGIEYLLEAWQKLAPEFPGWELTIVGPGAPAYVARLKKMAENGPRTVFLPEVTGKNRTRMYAQADLYVLPSHTENFGMTVAEALICGTPVVTTDGTPWTELPKRRAGWCVPVGTAPLETALRQALALPRNELARMGENGGNWMKEDFNWPTIGERMANAYRWLIDNGVGKPEYVVGD